MPRGGKRPGAGRKITTSKGICKKLAKFDAEALLTLINANQRWVELAQHADPAISLKAMIYLSDRAYGKPKQLIEGPGAGGAHMLVVRHSIPQPAR